VFLVHDAENNKRNTSNTHTLAWRIQTPFNDFISPLGWPTFGDMFSEQWLCAILWKSNERRNEVNTKTQGHKGTKKAGIK